MASKPYIKITNEDIEIAEEFFNNDKHLSEFLLNVIRYYRGKNVVIKTRIVEKYFKTYKKTMDFIMNAKNSGLKGYEKMIENQQVNTETPDRVLDTTLEDTLQGNIKDIIINNKSKTDNTITETSSVIPNKEASIKKEKELPLYSRMVEIWIKDTHPDFIFTATDGTKIKSLIKKITALLKLHDRETDDKSISDFFSMVCANLPEYFLDKDLKIIDSDFNQIIQKLKEQNNGKPKQKTSANQNTYESVREAYGS